MGATAEMPIAPGEQTRPFTALRRSAAALCGVALCLPGLAAGATLPISGSYGNELGCKLALTGEYNPVEGVELLTPTEMSTAVSLCTFKEIVSAPGNRLHVSMTCSYEGSGPEDDTEDKAEISGDPVAGYTVRFADGTSWGPLRKC